MTREEDINVFDGDEFVPQIPPPACAGPLHTVDVAGIAARWAERGRQPQLRRRRRQPLRGHAEAAVQRQAGHGDQPASIAPTFHLFTDVPIPGRWKGYIIDDLTLSTDPDELVLRRKGRPPNCRSASTTSTTGWSHRSTSDPNGVFEVLLPSTRSINCPTPSGVCSGRVLSCSATTPASRTVSIPTTTRNSAPSVPASRSTPGCGSALRPGADPDRVVAIQWPGSQFSEPARCELEVDHPAALCRLQPYARAIGRHASPSRPGLWRDDRARARSRWTASSLPTTALERPHDHRHGARTARRRGRINSMITADNGNSNGQRPDLPRARCGYNPNVFEVGPGRPTPPFRRQSTPRLPQARANPDLVVPGADPSTPLASTLENLVLYATGEAAGRRPWRDYTRIGTRVPGSVIDGRGVAGDTRLCR